MKLRNVSGQAYAMFPSVQDNPNLISTTLNLATTVSGNKVKFFSGAIPSNADVLNMTLASLDADYGTNQLMETPEFDVTYTYNVESKKRFIRKTEINALDMTYTTDGTISWAAILLVDPSSQNEYIIVTDSIGTWGSTTDPIIIDNKNGVVGGTNIFKNLSIELNDRASNNL